MLITVHHVFILWKVQPRSLMSLTDYQRICLLHYHARIGKKGGTRGLGINKNTTHVRSIEKARLQLALNATIHQ